METQNALKESDVEDALSCSEWLRIAVLVEGFFGPRERVRSSGEGIQSDS